MSLSITPLSPPDTRSKNAIDRMEHPAAVPIVKGVICVAPLEVNEPEAAINSPENELSEEEEGEEDSTSGIVESSTATVKRDKRQVSRRRPRPFAFVKSLATVMQLSSRNKRKVGSSRSCP